MHNIYLRDTPKLAKLHRKIIEVLDFIIFRFRSFDARGIYRSLLPSQIHFSAHH